MRRKICGVCGMLEGVADVLELMVVVKCQKKELYSLLRYVCGTSFID
jgi:hypothetical protein